MICCVGNASEAAGVASVQGAFGTTPCPHFLHTTPSQAARPLRRNSWARTNNHRETRDGKTDGSKALPISRISADNANGGLTVAIAGNGWMGPLQWTALRY